MTFGVVYVLFLTVSLVKLDPDFGWHLKAGEYFWQHGVPATDIFTYSASHFPWVDHEWLSDIFLYLIHSVGGYSLLAGLYAALWTGGLWLVGRRAPGPIVLVAGLAMSSFVGIRAMVWTVFGLTLCHVIVHLRTHHAKWLLVPLFLIWANVHGGFPIGLLYVVYIAIRKPPRALWGVLAASSAATLCNPYGIRLYTEIGQTMGDSSLHTFITEWMPVGAIWQALPYVTLWAASAYLIKGTNWRQYLSIDTLGLLTIVSGVRNYPLFVILSLPNTLSYLHELGKRLPKTLTSAQVRVAAGLFAVLAIIGIWSGASLFHAPLDREVSYPRQAVRYLQQHPCRGALFNDFNYGGYLIWQLPEQRVFIDGRMPSWTGPEGTYLKMYARVLTDGAYRDEVFAQYDIQCVLLGESTDTSGIIAELRREGWKVRVQANGGVLLERDQDYGEANRVSGGARLKAERYSRAMRSIATASSGFVPVSP